MDSRIFVIHPSLVIQQGLYYIIKDIFNAETILLGTTEELKSYNSVQNSRLIILADSRLDQAKTEKVIGTFDSTNNTKIVLVRDNADQSSCPEDCDCCFSLNDSKSRIEQLLNPYVNPSTLNTDEKNSVLLTEREIDVVKLVAFGKTNKEIANELYISIHTVISHRKNITEKLGIKSISGLTVYAMLNNLIDTSNINPNTLI